MKKLTKEATLPTRSHTHDAGLDLYASHDVSYKPNDIIRVPTGVAIAIDVGFVGLLRDRSSVGSKALKVTAGVIDTGYTGEVDVVLLNLSGQHGCIKAGSRIAQLLVMPIALPEVVEVETFTPSERGDKGFGSSGL